jgi:EmrB/QacA subfamily drug resistance transporter
MTNSFPEPDYSRKWLVMAAVGMGVFLGTIDVSIINVSLPTMMEALNTDFPTIQWVILSYSLTVTSLLLSVGRLADIRGKKQIYLLGFVIFTLGSMLCGISPTAGWLVSFRVLQALGAAMVTALGAAIVTDAFPPTERGKALGVIGTIVSGGIAAGPALGGLLIGTIGWRAIFFVNVPVGIVGVWMVRAFVPHDQPPGQQTFDFGGAGSLLVSLLGLLLGLTLGQRLGFTAPLISGLFFLFILSLIIFLIIEWRVTQPMVDLRLFRSPIFSISVLTAFMSFSAIGAFFIIPFYLQDVLGYSAAQVGLLLSVVPVVLAISAPVSGILSDRFGTQGLATAGLLLMAISFFMLRSLAVDTSALGYIVRMLPLGIGIGVFNSPNNSAIMGSVPRHHRGVASSFIAISRTLGQTTGVAVIGTIFAARTAVYAGHSVSANLNAADPAALVSGLQDAFTVVAIVIFAATLVSALGFWLKREQPASSY